jgi:hypothetical protein
MVANGTVAEGPEAARVPCGDDHIQKYVEAELVEVAAQ